MELRVLGPIELHNGHRLAIGGSRHRRLLAALALRPGEVVSVDRLADVVWADEPPPKSPERNVRTYVHRIRTAVGADLSGRFETVPPGYVLRLEPGELDAQALEDAVATASRLRDQGDAERALACVRTALELWRGTPYAEFADEDWIRPEVVRLGEVHASASELECALLLELGRSTEAIPRLEAIMTEHPLREKPRALQMRALYLAGRQADALRAFREFHRLLADETGLTPSDELVELDRSIAAGDALAVSHAPAIKGYVIREQIGSGSFASVYRAQRPGARNDVAIKVVGPELANDPEFIRTFEAEAEIIARLEHPHIVPIDDFWREPDRACLVMRWLGGGTLRASAADEPWDIEHVAALVEQIGGALTKAHQVGVAHGTVSAASVLLDEDGGTFLAKTAHGGTTAADDDLRPHRPGGLDDAARRVDIAGLARVAWEALVGRQPWGDGDEWGDPTRARAAEQLPTIHELRPRIPSAIDEVLAIAMAVDSPAGYRTVDDFVIAFRRAAHAPSSTASAATSSTEPPSPPVDNPYKGLQAFTEGDASDFFGRTRLIRDLIDRMNEPDGRLLAIVGPSGSGKSSVARAGLLPAVRRGEVVGGDRCFITSMIPTAHPFEALEVALLRIAVNPPASLVEQLRDGPRGLVRAANRIVPDDQSTVVLVIDQFEELFTHCTDESLRNRFLDALTEAVVDPASQLRIVLTLRADFFDEPLRHPRFAPILMAQMVAITPLAPDELEEVIVEPARQVGVAFEPGLVTELTADAALQPGALPLLQYALRELFELRTSETMHIADYERIGRLTGALARRADQLYNESDGEERQATWRLFTRLVTLGDGTEDTRRRVRRSELGDDDVLDAAIARFGAARLLTFDREPATRERTIEISHEALLRAWPRLRSWLDNDRVGLTVRQAITAAAARWTEDGRNPDDLLRTGRLDATLEYRRHRPELLNAEEHAFLDASEAARKAEQERIRSDNRRLRRLAVAVAAVAALALFAGLIALVQRNEADDARSQAERALDAAESARLAAEAQRVDPRLGILLAIEAHRRNDDAASLGALQSALLEGGPILGYLGRADRQYYRAQWSDSGDVIAVAHDSGIEVYDASSSELLWDAGTDATVVRRHGRAQAAGDHAELDVSADGRFAALATADNAVTLFDVESRVMTRLEHDDEVRALAFDHGGAVLATGDAAGRVTIWELATGTMRTQFLAHPEDMLDYRDELMARGHLDPLVVAQGNPAFFDFVDLGVAAIAFSADDSALITADVPVVRVWDVASETMSNEFIAEFENRFVGLASPIFTSTFDLDPVDPDLVYATTRTDLLRWNWRTGVLIEQMNVPPDRVEPVVGEAGAGRTPDGRWVSGLSDGRLQVVDTTGTVRETILHGLSKPADVAVDAAGRVVAVSGRGGVAIVSLDGRRLLADALPRIRPTNYAAILTSDGGLVSQTPSLGVPTFYRRGPGGYELVPHSQPPLEPLVVSTPNGRTVIADREGALFDLDTGERVGTAPGPVSRLWAQSSDGSLLAVKAPFGLEISVWDVRDWSVVADLEPLGEWINGTVDLRSISFDVTDEHLIATTQEGRYRIWGTDNWEPVDPPVDLGPTAIASFSPDGRYLATVDLTGVVTLRDADTFEPVRLLIGAGSVQDPAGSLLWSDDGAFVLTEFSAEPRLWEVETGRPVGDPFPNDLELGRYLSATPTRTVTAVGDWLLLWNLETSTWPDIACRAAGRNMTRQEWATYGPQGEPLRATCDGFPVDA